MKYNKIKISKMRADKIAPAALYWCDKCFAIVPLESWDPHIFKCKECGVEYMMDECGMIYPAIDLKNSFENSIKERNEK